MIFTPFGTSGTTRRVAAALLLAVTLTLTCAAPSHAWMGSGRPTADSADRPTPGGRFIHFLLAIFGFSGGGMDPNGNH
jgi:hypothetical protein